MKATKRPVSKPVKKVRLWADVRDGQLISQTEPYIKGAVWETDPDSISRAGSYYQDLRWTTIPEDHPIIKNLPDNCWIE